MPALRAFNSDFGDRLNELIIEGIEILRLIVFFITTTRARVNNK
jgi:hypothetical protein